MLLFVFLGLGAVIFLAVFVDAMAASTWEEDGADFSGLFNQQLPPAAADRQTMGNSRTGTTPLEDPATLFDDAELEEASTAFSNQANNTVAARQAQLSNSTWWNDKLFTIQFGPEGTYGTYHNGNSGFYLTQVDAAGQFHGSFVAGDGTMGTLYFQLPYDQNYLILHFVNGITGLQGSFELQRQ
ncbi:hypothetical protein QWY85_15170 [Neolewinella lacunae]|uniref:Uncharacterized protein n=1 Tax=Neolewinella lacunae TaxID=1517758 RepID=A0A923PKA2_9BACT|nr:hypothetical protein [Neolewinella lacunae]MBC6992763.1 hypothetical protein [Neolewinella lacunae]MDN3636007.1 hypothetical protein [Neolewinella lacunae]